MLFDAVAQEQEAITATRPETEIGMGFAFDWKNQRLNMQDGTPVLVYGVAAIKEWVQLVVRTRQGRSPIYPADFGAPVQDLIGQKAPKGTTSRSCAATWQNPPPTTPASGTWDRCGMTAKPSNAP